MPYRVFQDGVRCNDYNIKGWNNDTFLTMEEAQEYAVKWCYPCIINNYKEWPHPKELNLEVNMSYCESLVMMSIREVD